MAILDRLFGKKSGKPQTEANEPARPPMPTPWGLLIGENGDVCVAVGKLGRPVVSASLVFNPEFFDEERGTSPLRLLASHGDGTTTQLELARTREVAPVERIVKSPSVLLCEADGIGIVRMHHAPVFFDAVVEAPAPRRASPDARTYAATVLNVLDEGNALHEWKAFVRLEAGTFVAADEAFVTLYPAPPIGTGAKTTVMGTLRTDGGRTSMPSCTDAVLPENVRLQGFSAPFHLEVAFGTGDESQVPAAKAILGSVISAMSAEGCRAHGYREGTLHAYVRMLGYPFNRDEADARERFAVRKDGTVPSEDRASVSDRPEEIGWDMLAGPGDALTLYIDGVSGSEPQEAKLLVHDRPVVGRKGPASPLAILLVYGGGTKRKLLLERGDERAVEEIRDREAVRIVELNGDEPALSYDAAVVLQTPGDRHVPKA